MPTAKWKNAGRRERGKACAKCGKPFAVGDWCCVLTEEVSFMRGDDVVVNACRPCAVAAGYPFPEELTPQAELRRKIEGARGHVIGLTRKLEESQQRLADLERDLATINAAELCEVPK